MKGNTLEIYTLRNLGNEKLEKVILCYVHKKNDELFYQESIQLDPVVRKEYLEKIKEIIENLIKDNSIMLGWGEITKKNDGRIICHEYAQPCNVTHPEFLSALQSTFVRGGIKVFGHEIDGDIKS